MVCGRKKHKAKGEFDIPGLTDDYKPNKPSKNKLKPLKKPPNALGDVDDLDDELDKVLGSLSDVTFTPPNKKVPKEPPPADDKENHLGGKGHVGINGSGPPPPKPRAAQYHGRAPTASKKEENSSYGVPTAGHRLAKDEIPRPLMSNTHGARERYEEPRARRVTARVVLECQTPVMCAVCRITHLQRVQQDYGFTEQPAFKSSFTPPPPTYRKRDRLPDCPSTLALLCGVDLETEQQPIEHSPALELQRALSNITDRQRFSDAQFVAEGACIPVHRVILAARSPYLNDLMFGQGDAAADTVNVFYFDSIHARTLENVIDWLYSAQLSERVLADENHLPFLLVAAEQFQSPSLQLVVEQAMKRLLKPENACLYLWVAYTHGNRIPPLYEKTLFEECLDYIKTHAAAVKATRSWESFCIDADDRLVNLAIHEVESAPASRIRKKNAKKKRTSDFLRRLSSGRLALKKRMARKSSAKDNQSSRLKRRPSTSRSSSGRSTPTLDQGTTVRPKIFKR